MDLVTAKMNQARVHRIQIQEHEQEQFHAPVHLLHKNKKSRSKRPARSCDSSHRLVFIATGLASAALIVIVLWSRNLIGLGTGAGIDRSPSRVSLQVQQTVEPQKGYINRESTAEARSDEIRSETVSGLEMLPPTAAGRAKISTLTDANTNNSGTATGSDLGTKSIQPTVDVKLQRQEPDSDSGTWAINLASLQQKVNAEHFVAKTNSKGVAAEINKVMVRGKTYWRVQVPGFYSSDEARTKSIELQDKLGLKDVWIVQR